MIFTIIVHVINFHEKFNGMHPIEIQFLVCKNAAGKNYSSIFD